jgi:hypothetical protein
MQSALGKASAWPTEAERLRSMCTSNIRPNDPDRDRKYQNCLNRLHNNEATAEFNDCIARLDKRSFWFETCNYWSLYKASKYADLPKSERLE